MKLKRNYYTAVCFFMMILLFINSCQKDPYNGVKSNEKSIENFTMGEGFTQIGAAQVDREEGKVKVKVLVEEDTDFSKVKPLIQQSYRAEIHPESGEEVDFLASQYRYTYTVTAETGENRDWIVEIEPFEEDIVGEYKINDLVLYGGTGPEYGGGAVMSLTSKPWVWPEENGPEVEMDNKITFTLEGVRSNGRTFGKVINDAGNDGLYADFIYQDPKTDVNYLYRKVPKGEGVWERDYTTGMLTIIHEDGRKEECSLLEKTTEDLGNGLSKSIDNYALVFALEGEDDWDAIFSDYDKFVKKPRRYWIEIEKTN